MGIVLVENRGLAVRGRGQKSRAISKMSPALMIAEEDIKQRLSDWRKVPSWIKDHVSTRQPIHRYEGELLIKGETLYFNTSFKSCFAHTEGNNRHWYEMLYEILTKYRSSKAVGQRNQPLVKA